MAIHPVFVHFHTGILAAAAVLGLINLLLRILFRDSINTPGTRLAKVFHQFDVFIYIGSIIGFLGLIVAMITGFMEPDYPLSTLVLIPIMRFKILWSIVAVEIYLYLMIVRTKLGDRVWVNASSYFPYAILVIFGGVLMMSFTMNYRIVISGISYLKII